MANPQKGEVEFKVDGKTYTLKLGHNARATAEGLLGGTPFHEIIGGMLDPKTVNHETVRAVLYAGLNQHHPGLTLFDIGDIMDEVGDEYVGERLGEALTLAAPKASAAAVPPRKTKQSRAGTKS